MTQYLSLDEISAKSGVDKQVLAGLDARQPIRITRHYSSLIDWQDPNDPLRKVVVPSEDESGAWGAMDPSAESDYTKDVGIQHKYGPTALLLVSDNCHAFCRYCFRKRLFGADNEEVPASIDGSVRYIESHAEVRDVILSGGDPLFLSTRSIADIVWRLARIPHLTSIRLHTRVLAFSPNRISEDADLLSMLAQLTARFNVTFGVHFDHVRELTPAAKVAIEALKSSRVEMVAQCPLLRGVNDTPEALRELFVELSRCGCPPYYLLQCRPVAGSRHFVVPIEIGISILRQARLGCTGPERRARYVMAHRTGKIEIVGVTDRHLVMCRQSSPNVFLMDTGLIVAERSNSAGWLDELRIIDSI